MRQAANKELILLKVKELDLAQGAETMLVESRASLA